MQPSKSVIEARVSALTRIAKNNAVAADDLAVFAIAEDFAMPRDLFPICLRDTINDLYRERTNASDRSALAAISLALNFLTEPVEAPRPLSERRALIQEDENVSESTVVRRERRGAALVAKKFNESARRSANRSIDTNSMSTEELFLISEEFALQSLDGATLYVYLNELKKRFLNDYQELELLRNRHAAAIAVLRGSDAPLNIN